MTLKFVSLFEGPSACQAGGDVNAEIVFVGNMKGDMHNYSIPFLPDKHSAPRPCHA